MREGRVVCWLKTAFAGGAKTNKWKNKRSLHFTTFERDSPCCEFTCHVDELFHKTARHQSSLDHRPIFPVRFPDSQNPDSKILFLFPQCDRGISAGLMDLSWRSRGFGYHGHGPDSGSKHSQISRFSRWRCSGDESGRENLAERK